MARDLSLSHEPVTDLFNRDLTAQQWDAFRLSDAQVEQYATRGYVDGVQLLNQEQIDVLCDEFAELTTPDHDGSELWYEYHSNESDDPNAVLFHALGAWRIKPALHDILWNPAFLVPASQLLDGAVRFWHDQLFCKPAGHGGVVAWHQDYSYWTRTKPMQHLTCWIGLDDSTTENGCLNYVPGSHHWPLLPTTDLANDMEAIRGVLSEEQSVQFKPVPIEMKAGQAAMHHPLLLHGSYENRSERPRRAIVINVFRDGTICDSDEPLLDGAAAIPAGQPMGGQFHPLLYDAS
jgi:hypothetical protein